METLSNWKRLKTWYRYAREYIPWLNWVRVWSLLSLGKDDRFLDVGCYQGLFIIEAAKRGTHSIGLDIQKVQLKEALMQSRRLNVDMLVDFVIGDAHHLPFKYDYFSKVLCAEVLEHLPSPGRAVNEIRRVLHSQGWAVITVPTTNGIPWYCLYRKLRDLIQQNYVASTKLKQGKVVYYSHIQEFTSSSIFRLIERHGLCVKKMVAVGVGYLFPQRLLNNLHKWQWIWTVLEKADKLGHIPPFNKFGILTALKCKRAFNKGGRRKISPHPLGI